MTVADRGIGIPPAISAGLFERYYRGGNVSGIVGTGVGLYLVKTAVGLHKGRDRGRERGRQRLALYRSFAAQASYAASAVADEF